MDSLDRRKLAEQLRKELLLEVAEMGADLQYDHDTSFCSFCPGNDGDCCKNNGGWEEAHEDDQEYIASLHILAESLELYIGELP